MISIAKIKRIKHVFDTRITNDMRHADVVHALGLDGIVAKQPPDVFKPKHGAELFYLFLIEMLKKTK